MIKRAKPEKTTSKTDKQRLHELCKINPLMTWLYLFSNWLSIIFVVYMVSHTNLTILYLLSIIFIGSRQHSLGFHYHEACHGLLFNNKKLNDIVGVITMGWPLFISLKPYRKNHLQHHRFTNTSKDPDWVRNQPEKLKQSQSFIEFIVIISGIDRAVSALQRSLTNSNLPAKGNRLKNKETMLQLLYYTIIATIFSVLNAWHFFILYWLVPFVFYFIPALRIRGITEHWATSNEFSLNNTRTIIVSTLTKFLLFPKNTNHHLEHHLYPGVPFYRLPKVHKILIKEPKYQKDAHVTYGIRGFINELWAEKSTNNDK